MKKWTSLIAIAAALSLTAGCAHRRTADQLPPEPPSSTEIAADTGDQSGNVSGTPLPGSRGDLIAFTRTGAFQIGVMPPAGGAGRILTSGGGAEGPSWAPNGRAIMFTRGLSAGQLWYVDVASGATRRVPTPLGGSDPAWSPLRN